MNSLHVELCLRLLAPWISPRRAVRQSGAGSLSVHIVISIYLSTYRSTYLILFLPPFRFFVLSLYNLSLSLYLSISLSLSLYVYINIYK